MAGIGTDEGVIFDILNSRVNKNNLIYHYYKFFNSNLIEDLMYELDSESFNRAYKLINTKK